MFNNDDITLFNSYYEDGITKYNKTYISGVDWQSTKAIKLTEKGLLSADTFKIFIPYLSDFNFKEYIKPKSYAKLDDKYNYFTLKQGDIIVKGKIDFELTGIKPNNLKYLEETFDDVVYIMSVIDCELTGNWEVGAR